jgi:hypothetical protein
MDLQGPRNLLHGDITNIHTWYTQKSKRKYTKIKPPHATSIHLPFDENDAFVLQEKVSYLHDTHTTMKRFLQQNLTHFHDIDAIVKNKTSPLQMA